MSLVDQELAHMLSSIGNSSDDYAHTGPAPIHACKIWVCGGNIYLEYPDREKDTEHRIVLPRNGAGIEALLRTLIERDKRYGVRPTQPEAYAIFKKTEAVRAVKVTQGKPAKYRGGKIADISLEDLGL